MKKFHANCQLNLDISREGDVFAFRFKQPPFGGYLATIRTKKIEQHDPGQSSSDIPSWFTRLGFSLTSGIKNYELACRLVDDEKPYDYANFYRCRDRRNRERFFAEINEAETDCGCSFLISTESFEGVLSQIRKTLANKTGERDGRETPVGP
ncbi:hypothetical protein [Haloferula rosea]|uniref:Uncharacterized protein n=1 Tax=Haloferula rosea TaxID=490093 RepID=A0A934VD21_9BACT|nr:hypothetical protein [Haloferula rosea]MBK1829053.1 hypothetical protein [Haloferula rosea]